MYAYKGFEPDLSCRGYRFVMGKNVTPEANCASNGFHCAEDPLDCLSYYGDICTPQQNAHTWRRSAETGLWFASFT